MQKTLSDAAYLNMPEIQMKSKPNRFSEETKKLLEERNQAYQTTNINNINEIENTHQQNKRKDNNEATLNTMSAALDVRDRWAGIRLIKKRLHNETI